MLPVGVDGNRDAGVLATFVRVAIRCTGKQVIVLQNEGDARLCAPLSLSCQNSQCTKWIIGNMS